MTIITRLPVAQSTDTVLTGPAHFRQNSFEHCLSYDRIDGKRVEMVITHVPNVSGDGEKPALLQIATRKLQRNPTLALNEHVALSMEEARLLKDLLNRPEISAYLDEA